MKHKKKPQAQEVKPASLEIILQLAAIREILNNVEREVKANED